MESPWLKPPRMSPWLDKIRCHHGNFLIDSYENTSATRTSITRMFPWLEWILLFLEGFWLSNSNFTATKYKISKIFLNFEPLSFQTFLFLCYAWAFERMILMFEPSNDCLNIFFERFFWGVLTKTKTLFHENGAVAGSNSCWHHCWDHLNSREVSDENDKD